MEATAQTRPPPSGSTSPRYTSEIQPAEETRSWFRDIKKSFEDDADDASAVPQRLWADHLEANSSGATWNPTAVARRVKSCASGIGGCLFGSPPRPLSAGERLSRIYLGAHEKAAAQRPNILTRYLKMGVCKTGSLVAWPFFYAGLITVRLATDKVNEIHYALNLDKERDRTVNQLWILSGALAAAMVGCVAIPNAAVATTAFITLELCVLACCLGAAILDAGGYEKYGF